MRRVLPRALTALARRERGRSRRFSSSRTTSATAWRNWCSRWSSCSASCSNARRSAASTPARSTPGEVERLGTTFLRLAEEIDRLKEHFGFTDEDLNLNLGPLGKLRLKDKLMAQAQVITRSTHGDSLADILERVLNTGVVIAGDIRIKLCDVELLSIQLRLLICSVEKARELGISWWWQSAPHERRRSRPPRRTSRRIRSGEHAETAPGPQATPDKSQGLSRIFH